jgi:hypothetical protein
MTRKTVTIYTRTYAPWEEDEDEPRMVDQCEDVNDTVMWLSPLDDYTTPVEVAVAILTGECGPANRFYALEPSSYPLKRAGAGRVWWSAETYTHPTGEREESTAHLSGFTEQEAWEVHKRVAAVIRERNHITIPVDA